MFKEQRCLFFLFIFILILNFTLAAPDVTFPSPTPDSGSLTQSTSILINISIVEPTLSTITYDWNGVNFTVYSSSLVFLANLNNDSNLNENSTQFQDISLKNITGSCVNCPTFNSTGGKSGGAYDFDGTNDYLNFTNAITGADFTNKTLMAWIYPQLSTGGMGIIDKDYDDSPGLYGGYGLWLQSNNKLWWWAHSNKDILDTGSLTAPDNTWTHVAVVWDNTSKMAYFYINGRLNSNKSDTTIVENSSKTASFVIGSIRSGSLSFFNGLIDDPEVWNVSMTQQQIYQHYTSTLRKYNNTQWQLLVNQSQNATQTLSYNTYSYYAVAQNISSDANTMSVRTLIIGFTTNGSVPEWGSYGTVFILVIVFSGFFYVRRCN